VETTWKRRGNDMETTERCGNDDKRRVETTCVNDVRKRRGNDDKRRENDMKTTREREREVPFLNWWCSGTPLFFCIIVYFI
jgi:hypothetical protein